MRRIRKAGSEPLLVSFALLALAGGSFASASFVIPSFFPATYDELASIENPEEAVEPAREQVAHLKTPEPLKALYMSQCVVGTPSFRADLVTLVDETELNAIVIDIKDYTGKIAFRTDNPILADSVSDACGARDMKDFVKTLHDKEIYVIGRVTVFQSPHHTKTHPEWAVQSASTGAPWKDHKGLSFVDVGAKPYWEYVVALAKESYALGFDEINFDYIRFPSDGPMKDAVYTWSKGKAKPDALEDFFAFLHTSLKDTGVVTSADLFGMTTTNTDDLNIGQVLERTLPYFDYVAPMVYPSHYPPGFNGWKNLNNYPHDVVAFSMGRGAERAVATTTTIAGLTHTPIASTSPQLYAKPSYSKLKLRTWIQDFDYGGTYDIPEVKAQIQATYDANLTSWMLWAPSNRYTRGALLSN